MSRELFRGFDPAFVTDEELSTFDNPAAFVEAGLYVVDKLASLLGALAKAPRDQVEAEIGDAPVLGRDDAVLRGLLVRLRKLFRTSHLIADAGQGDFLFSLARMEFETAVNLGYLLEKAEFDEYVTFSLTTEIDLLSEVKRNVSVRGGDPAEIEKSMLRSIEASFAAAGVTMDQVRKRRKDRATGLFGKTVEERAIDLRLGTKHERATHIGAFSIPSHNVHGNWEDLRINHLEHQGGSEFKPWLRWNEPEPQLLVVPAFLTAEILRRFVEQQSYSGDFAKAIDELLPDIQEASSLILRKYDQFKYGEDYRGDDAPPDPMGKQ